jgi:O-antigen/teichoic acid export membrane protein
MLREQLKTLGKHAVIYGSADVFPRVINLLLMPVFTFYLSPENYGVLGILVLFGVTTKILFRMGLDSGFFRLYYEQDSDREKKVFCTTIFAAAATVGLIGLIATVWAADPISRFLLGGGRDFIILVAVDIFLTVFAFVPMNLYRILEQSQRFTAVSLFRNGLNLSLKVILVVSGWGVAGVLWADLIAAAFFILLLSPTLVVNLCRGFSWQMLSSALSFGLPKVPHALAYQILNLADRKLLHWFGSLEQVGIYHVAYQFGLGIKFFLSAFELAWSPFIYSILKRADHPQTLARIATYASIVLWTLALGIAVLSRELLILMTTNPAFHAGYPVIPLIVLSHVFQGMFLLTSIGIGISKNTYPFPVMTLAAAVLNVSMNLALIPRLGMMGAAWSTVAGYALMLVMGIYYSNRLYRLPFEWGRMGRIAFAALFCYGLSLLAPVAVLPALAVKVFVLALFPATLYLLGFFRDDEIRQLKRVLASRANGARPEGPDPP